MEKRNAEYRWWEFIVNNSTLPNAETPPSIPQAAEATKATNWRMSITRSLDAASGLEVLLMPNDLAWKYGKTKCGISVVGIYC